MFIRKLRSTDISKIYILNPNEQDVDYLRTKPHLHSSIGLFVNRELKAYVLVRKNREDTKTFHLINFYSNSITYSFALFSRLSHLRQSSFEVHFHLSAHQVERLENISKYSYYSRFSCENESKGMKKGKFHFSRYFAFKRPSLELLRILHRSNAMGYEQFNLPFKSVLFQLLTKFTPVDIQRREGFILSHLHKRNTEVLKQFNSSMSMISTGQKKIYLKFKDSYSNALKEKDYQELKENSTSYKHLHNGDLSFLDYPQYYVFHADVKQVEIGNLIHFPSPYYEEKYAFFRKQMSFIRNSFHNRDGKNNWFFLDYEGYKLFSAYEIPKNIYHFIPRNFQTIFRSVLNEANFVENMFTLFKNKDESLYFDSNSYFGLESSYGHNHDYYRFFKLLFKISKYVGKEFVLDFAGKLNVNKANFKLYSLTHSLEVLLSSNLLTAKAWEIFLTKYSTTKKEQIAKIVNSIVSNYEPLKMPIPKSLRKSMSQSIKKMEKEEGVMNSLFEHISLSYIENQCKNEKEVQLLTSILFKLKKIITPKNIDIYLNFLNHYLKYQVKLSKLKKLEVLLTCIDKAESLSIFSPDSMNYYFFNVALGVKSVTTDRFFKSFIEKWTSNAANNQNPSRFIHDTGYIYEKVMRLHSILSKEVILKIYSSNNYEYISTVTDEIRFLHETIRTYFHNNKAGKSLFKQILNDIEKAIASELSLDEIKNSLMSMINEKILEKYNLKGDQEFLEKTELFLGRMAKYRPSISLSELFLYLKDNTIPIINGNYEGSFLEKRFFLLQTELGLLIRKALGDKDNKPLVSKPKKLYGLLSAMGNVSELMKGNIRPEDTNTILKLLRERRVLIPKVLHKIPNLYGKIEPKCSPEFLVAGDASVCCMSFGEDNAVSYALEKGFGVFNVYYNNRVIANSVIWINELYNVLVIDNIEVHPNYENLNDYIRNIYFKMIEQTLIDYNLKGAVQGNSYNDLDIANENIDFKHKFKAKDVKSRDFYTDAYYVSPIETSKMSAREISEYLQSKANTTK